MTDPGPTSPTGASNLEDLYELTPLQHGMLFQHLYAPTDGAYTEQAVLTLRGPVHRDAFWRAWQLVVDRHPVLRTSFHWDKADKPVQAVHRRVRLARDEVDWRHLPRTTQDKQLRQTLREEKRRGLDLTVPPPIRVTLYQVADDRHHIALRFSHLVGDGWSMGLILSDFVTGYQAYAAGREVVLPPPAHFRDYVAWWQRQQPDTVADFWKEHLAGYQPPAPLRLGPVPALPAEAMPIEWEDLELADLAEPLRAYSHQHRLSLHTLTQGAWTLALAHCAKVSDLAVGTTLAHRPADLPGAESIVGCLVVTVPVRSRVEADQPVADWLHQLQDSIIAVRDHSAASITDIQRWTTGHGTDPFESIVAFQNFPLPSFAIEEVGLSLEQFTLDTRVPVPLVLMALPGDHLPMRLIYDRRRFAPEAAQLMLRRLRAALASIVDGATRLGDVDVLAGTDPAPATTGAGGQMSTTDPEPAVAGTDVQPPTETEQALATLVAQLLHLDRVDIHDDLIELGLHSLLGTRLVNRIRDEWQTPLALSAVFDRPTVARIAAVIEAGGSAPAAAAASMPDLAADVRLDDEVTAATLPPASGARDRLLLTGATGYLGTLLLARLLTDTDARVTCLVRGEDTQQAHQRLRERLTTAGRWEERFADRIEVCLGNLARPRLGLSEHDFHALAERIDEIYHLAASANIMPPYRRVRPGNVRGTHEVLRLATTTRLKPVHHISPAEVTDHPDPARAGAEAAAGEQPPDSLHNGYIQSKWVADRLLTLAASRGVPTAVYRAARLIGGPGCDHWKLGDGVSEIVRACARLGLVPESEIPVPVSPVDYVAAGIATLAGRGESTWGGYYHLTAARPFRFDDLAEAMRRTGWPVRRAPLQQWYAELVRASHRDGTGHWDLVLAVLGPWVRAARQGPPEPEYRCDRARAALDGTLPAPAVDADYLHTVLAQLIDAGHLTAPESEPVGEPAPAAGGSSAGRATAPDLGQDELAQVREWESTYDRLYQQPPPTDFGEDFSGWHSSYDGQPIPLAQMRQWRDATLERIRSLRPRRVLEIGAGSGLLLAHLAPQAERYWAVDISSRVVGRLTAQIGAVPQLAAKTRVWRAAAHDLTDDLVGEVDLIVLNSVVQYFPTGDYLARVLSWAVRALAPDGAVFCGDVRDLRLLRCFHTAVQLAQARTTDPATLRAETERAQALEEELVVHPAFFTDLRDQVPELGAVDILLKRGQHHNELTRYRYDVVLHRRPVDATRPHLHRWPWGEQVSSLTELGSRLAAERPGLVRVTTVPNARVADELAATRELFAAAGGTPSAGQAAAVDPEQFCQTAEHAGYRADLTWSAADEGGFDAVLTPAGAAVPIEVVPEPTDDAVPGRLVNDPMATT